MKSESAKTATAGTAKKDAASKGRFGTKAKSPSPAPRQARTRPRLAVTVLGDPTLDIEEMLLPETIVGDGPRSAVVPDAFPAELDTSWPPAAENSDDAPAAVAVTKATTAPTAAEAVHTVGSDADPLWPEYSTLQPADAIDVVEAPEVQLDTSWPPTAAHTATTPTARAARKASAELTTDDGRATRIASERRATEARAAEKRAAEQEAARREDQKRAAEQLAAEQRAKAEKLAAEQEAARREDEKRAAEQLAAEQRAKAELEDAKRAAKALAAEKRAAEQRAKAELEEAKREAQALAAEKLAAEERAKAELEDAKRAAKALAAEKRAAEQRAKAEIEEATRAAEERAKAELEDAKRAAKALAAEKRAAEERAKAELEDAKRAAKALAAEKRAAEQRAKAEIAEAKRAAAELDAARLAAEQRAHALAEELRAKEALAAAQQAASVLAADAAVVEDDAADTDPMAGWPSAGEFLSSRVAAASEPDVAESADDDESGFRPYRAVYEGSRWYHEGEEADTTASWMELATSPWDLVAAQIDEGTATNATPAGSGTQLESRLNAVERELRRIEQHATANEGDLPNERRRAIAESVRRALGDEGVSPDAERLLEPDRFQHTNGPTPDEVKRLLARTRA